MNAKSRMDLNADLGEGFPYDAVLLEHVTSANVCCGAHAGDPDTIRETLRMAGERGVVVGAHPGYPDRKHFGRGVREISTSEARELVLAQIDDLEALAKPLGVPIQYIKPHGGLYNQAQDDSAIAAGLVEAAAERGVPVLGLPSSKMETAAQARGVRFVPEGFVDRGYQGDGRLIPRTKPLAVVTNLVALVLQLERMIESEPPKSLIRTPLDEFRAEFHSSWLRVETLCIHGDRPESVDLAMLVAAALRLSKVNIKSFVSA